MKDFAKQIEAKERARRAVAELNAPGRITALQTALIDELISSCIEDGKDIDKGFEMIQLCTREAWRIAAKDNPLMIGPTVPTKH